MMMGEVAAGKYTYNDAQAGLTLLSPHHRLERCVTHEAQGRLKRDIIRLGCDECALSNHRA